MKFGKYEIIKEIGKGAMGVVYLAFDPIIERQVAIKTMNPQLFEDREQKERFFREAKSAGILQHPNIVTIYDMGMEGDTPFIVMEYVEGKDLDSLIKKGEVDREFALKIMKQLCDALGYAHSKGIIHRDIKPSNIRVLADGTVKVMDFGIAKKSGSDLTQTGVLLGTVSYMAPEQLKEGKVSPQSDQFSAGIVFYEMLSGKKCFKGDTITSVMFQIVSFDEKKLNLDFVPEHIATVVKKMVSPDTSSRFSSCSEVAKVLENLISGTKTGSADVTVPIVPPIPPVPQAKDSTESQEDKTVMVDRESKDKKKTSKTGLLVFVFIFVVVLAAGVAGVYYFGKPHLFKKAVNESSDKANKPMVTVEKNSRETNENILPDSSLAQTHTTAEEAGKAKQVDSEENRQVEVKKEQIKESKNVTTTLTPEKKKTTEKEKPIKKESAKSFKAKSSEEAPVLEKSKSVEKEVFSYSEGAIKKERRLNFTEGQREALRRFKKEAEHLTFNQRSAKANALFNAGMRALGNNSNRFAAVSFYKSILLNPKKKEAYSFLCVALSRLKAYDDIKKVIKMANKNGIGLYELRKNRMFDGIYNRLVQKGLLE